MMLTLSDVFVNRKKTLVLLSEPASFPILGANSAFSNIDTTSMDLL
jgi:hypothetical protein